ncbi:hypothetical protein [Desulfonema ishimotonii]|nr:hypothetical protein [Desulfonema ishimotonii]
MKIAATGMAGPGTENHRFAMKTGCRRYATHYFVIFFNVLK